MKKDQPHVFDRYKAGEEVSGAEMVAATAVHTVAGLLVAFVQWVGCMIGIVIAFAIGGFLLGIPAVALTLWWAFRQAARGLAKMR